MAQLKIKLLSTGEEVTENITHEQAGEDFRLARQRAREVFNEGYETEDAAGQHIHLVSQTSISEF